MSGSWGVERKPRNLGDWAAGGSEGPRGNTLSDKCSVLVWGTGEGGGERMGRSGFEGSWGRLLEVELERGREEWSAEEGAGQ